MSGEVNRILEVFGFVIVGWTFVGLGWCWFRGVWKKEECEGEGVLYGKRTGRRILVL